MALIIIKCDPKGGDIDHSTIVQCIAQKLTTMSIIIVLPFVCTKRRALIKRLLGKQEIICISRFRAIAR